MTDAFHIQVKVTKMKRRHTNKLREGGYMRTDSVNKFCQIQNMSSMDPGKTNKIKGGHTNKRRDGE